MILKFKSVFGQICARPCCYWLWGHCSTGMGLYNCNLIDIIPVKVYAIWEKLPYFCKMRLIVFILAVIVLSLTCLPCADGFYIIKSGKSKTAVAKVPTQENDQDHNDACSPFCHCTCCAGFSINHVIASVNSLDHVGKINFVSSIKNAVIDISLPIWQPPQLVS